MLKSRLKHLKREEIDVKKWDEIIKNAVQSRIYAFSWYLDAITDGKWSALIIDDYVAVFPVLVKKILFIPYVTHPFLCQQLGLFSKNHAFFEEYSIIISKYLTTNFLKTDTTINNTFVTGKNISSRSNHILPLDLEYDDLYKKYNRNTKRNINKANESNLILYESDDVSAFVEFIKSNDESGIAGLIETNISHLISASFTREIGTIIMAKDEDGVHSSAFYIIHEQRIHFLLCASDSIGKEKKAMFLIIDEIIRKYAGFKYVFDFTGSNIENISRRNEGFGAETEIYYHLKLLWSPSRKL
jgi:hypothetical protein